MKTKKVCCLPKLLMLLLILLTILKTSKSQNEIEELENNFLKDKTPNKEDKDSQKKSHVIPEINDIEGLKKFFAENKKFIFEVYSSTCPHCIKLAPELDKLALMYKDTVKFVKTDGRDSFAYRSIVKVDHFPSLYIFDNGNLIELGGSLNFDTLKKYIDEKYFFKCERIKTAEELKTKVSELADKRFFIGILDEANLKNAFELFYKLMYENMLIVENCYYFSNNKTNNNNDNNNSNKNENQKTNFLNFYSTLKNFILINNSEKINVYEDLDFLLNFPSQHQDPISSANKRAFAAAVDSLSKTAKNYFFDNSFASVFKFTKKEINLIFQNPKLRAVFSYDKLSKDAVLAYSRMFVAQRKNVENYNIMLFDLDADSKEFDDEEKMYLYFTRVPGVHFTNQNFENIFHFDLNSLDILKINEFADDNFAKFKTMLEAQNNSLSVSGGFDAGQENRSAYGKAESKGSNSSAGKSNANAASANAVNGNGNVNGFGVEKKFVTAKIVEKLDKINYDEKGNINELHSDNGINKINDYNNQYSDTKIINTQQNKEKNKLAEDFVKGKNKNANEELNKNINSALVKNNNSNDDDFDDNNPEDPKKHELGVNKIKILLIYLVIYSAIYFFFYSRISKRDESKYN